MQFYVRTMYDPPTLLRRSDDDAAFIGGRWQPTNRIVDYQYGNDVFIEPITEADARSQFPQAFA